MVKQVIAVFWIVGICLLLEVNAKRPDRYGRSHSISSGKSYKKHLTKHGFEDDDNDSDFSHELVKHRSSSSHHDEKIQSDEDYLPMKEIISSIVEDDEILSGKKGPNKGKGKLKYGADGAIHYFTKNGNHHHAHHHYFYEDSDEAEDGKFDDDNDLSSEHKDTSKPQLLNRPGSYESYPKEALKSSKKHKFTYDDKLLGNLHKNKFKPELSYLKDYSHPKPNKYSIEGSHFGGEGFVHITPTPYKTSYKTAHKDFYHGPTKPLKIKFDDGHYSDKHKDIMYGFSKQPTFQGVPIKESKKHEMYNHDIKDLKKPPQESVIQESDYLGFSKGYPESLSQHKTKYEDSWTASKPLEPNSDLFKYESDYFPKGSKYTLSSLSSSLHNSDDEQFKDFGKDFKPPTKQKFNLEDALVPSKGLYSGIKSKPVFEENVSTFDFPKSSESSYKQKPSTKPKYSYDTSLLRHTTTKAPKVSSFESSFLDSPIKPVYDPESPPTYKEPGLSYKPPSKPKHKFVGLYPELSKPQFDYENYSSRPKYEYENSYSHETTTKPKFEYESTFPQHHTTTKPKFDYEHSYPFLPTLKPKQKLRPTTQKPKYNYEAYGPSSFTEEDSILSSKKPSYTTFTKPSSFEDSQKHWQYEQNEEDEENLQKQKKKKCHRHKGKKGKSHKHFYNVAEEEEKFTDEEYPSKHTNYLSDYKQETPKVQEEEYKEYKSPQEEKHIIYYNKEKRRKANASNKQHSDIDSGSLRKYLNLERDQAFNRSLNKESSKPGQKATNFHYTSSSYTPDYDYKKGRATSRRALYSSYEEQ